jgi:predicted ATP-grasp superfamily ATP-dependent carboligase
MVSHSFPKRCHKDYQIYIYRTYILNARGNVEGQKITYCVMLKAPACGSYRGGLKRRRRVGARGVVMLKERIS